MAGGAHRDEVDPEVMDAAIAGDDDAFATVVRYYDRRLRSLAWRLLGDRGAMDDCLQDAYVKAHRALPTFRRGAAPGTWLYRITYNACIDELRRRLRRPLQRRAEVPEEADPGAGPESLVTDRTVLGRALADLPPDHRAVVLLVDAEGYDYDSAAEILGVAPGTVASRLSRARASLRAALGDIR
jgi:RNA polymerase sigma-70 factor, ECF subfamily